MSAELPKVVGVAIVKHSADRKVMTITDEGTDRKGEKFSQVWCLSGSEVGDSGQQTIAEVPDAY